MILASSTSDFVSYMAAGISEGSITRARRTRLLAHAQGHRGDQLLAQGAFVTLGAYIAVWASRDKGWPLFLAYLFAVGAMFPGRCGLRTHRLPAAARSVDPCGRDRHVRDLRDRHRTHRRLAGDQAEGSQADRERHVRTRWARSFRGSAWSSSSSPSSPLPRW